MSAYGGSGGDGNVVVSELDPEVALVVTEVSDGRASTRLQAELATSPDSHGIRQAGSGVTPPAGISDAVPVFKLSVDDGGPSAAVAM